MTDQELAKLEREMLDLPEGMTMDEFRRLEAISDLENQWDATESALAIG